jgi:hypothetical protein
VTEKSQRYGSSSVAGSGRLDHFDMNSVHDKLRIADHNVKEAYQGTNPNRGYGGKYGTEHVMDKVSRSMIDIMLTLTFKFEKEVQTNINCYTYRMLLIFPTKLILPSIRHKQVSTTNEIIR